MSEFNKVRKRLENKEYKTLEEAYGDMWFLIGFGDTSKKIESDLKRENDELNDDIQRLETELMMLRQCAVRQNYPTIKCHILL